MIAKLKIGNVQQKITPALKQNNKKTFSNLDQSYKNQVIKKRTNAKDVNILQNINQIATSKKPISFRSEGAMNAAIKKQENASLLAQHKFSQKKKALDLLNSNYSGIQKDSLLQSSMKQEIKSRLENNLKNSISLYEKQNENIIKKIHNQTNKIINKLKNPYNRIQTKQKESNLNQELESLKYKINAVQYHTAKQKNAANNRYNVIKSKKPSVKREIKSEEDYSNTIKKLLEKYNPRQQNYQDKSTSPLVNYIDSNINITTRNNYQ